MSKAKAKNKKRHIKFKTALFKGGYIHNSVLTSLTGIVPIAAAATNLKNSLWLSLTFSAAVIVCEIIASALLKKISRWVRIAAYAVISAGIMTAFILLADGKTVSSLGIYLPLLCVNGIIVVRCEKFAVRTNVLNSFFDSIATALGFSVVCIVTGSVRSMIAEGSLFGFATNFPAVSAIAMPFGGLVILGFLAALHKWSIIKLFPNEIVDGFSLNGAFEKATFKEPGLGYKKSRQQAKKVKAQIDEYDKIRPRYSIEDINIDVKEKTEDDT